MFDHIKRFPVIHSGPFEVLVGNLKAEGVNQVKSTVGEGTNSTDVSSVLRISGQYRTISIIASSNSSMLGRLPFGPLVFLDPVFCPVGFFPFPRQFGI